MSENQTLIECGKQLAKPWSVVCYLLAGLLCISVIGNIIQANKTHDITIEQENVESDFNNNGIIE